MKLGMIALVLGISAGTAGCAYNPTVLGTKLDRKALCPSAGKYCSQNIANISAVSLTKEPRYLPALPSGDPDLWTFLGREYTRTGSPIVNFCGNEATNPFRTYAGNQPDNRSLVIDKVATNSVTFSRKASTRRSFAASVDIDQLLNTAGVPTGTARIQAEAALRTALANLDKSEVQMRGRYSFVYLDPSVLALLKANTVPTELKACSDALRSGATPIIASMTLARIDTLTSSGTIKNDASSSVEAALKGTLDDAKLASLKAEFERSIEQTYSTAFSPTWQVLSIGGYDGT